MSYRKEKGEEIIEKIWLFDLAKKNKQIPLDKINSNFFLSSLKKFQH